MQFTDIYVYTQRSGWRGKRWGLWTISCIPQQCLDLVILPETRWSFTSEWTTDEWRIIHSGTHKFSGIMIMISKRLKPAGHIAWQSLVDGRLLHVRLRGDRPIDVIGVYQAHASSRVQGEPTNQRAHTFKALDDLLQTIPRRNQVIVGGDFNTTLPEIPHVCPASSLRWKGAVVPNHLTDDSHALAQTIAQHGLVGLNCWHQHACPTFVCRSHASGTD